MITTNNLFSGSFVSHLTKLGVQLSLSNERLVSGKRVNKASDDPSGIVSIAKFDQEIAQLESAISNASRIENIIDTADGAMGEIGTLLDDISAAVTAGSGGMVTTAERDAYQATIDTAIDSIDRIVNSTTFNGTKLLDGAMGYNVGGFTTGYISNVRVKSADTSGGNITVNLTVATTEAAATVSSGGFSTIGAAGKFNVTGNLGTAEVSWEAGDTRADIAQIINDVTTQTGVTATDTGARIDFKSQNKGSDQFVKIQITEGSFAMSTATTDYGDDATVTIDGNNASVSGNSVYYTNGQYSVEFAISNTIATTGGNAAFTISGDGANWSMDNSQYGKIHFGQASQNTANLGNQAIGYLKSLRSGGTNDLSSGNYTTAGDIATLAKSQVTNDRSRIGAIKTYTIDTSVNSYNSSKTAMTEAKSNIEDLDYAMETANNTRLQAMMNMTTTIMSAMNQNASNILSLLTL